MAIRLGPGMPTVSAEVAFTTAPGATPTWTDITQYVREAYTKRGRQRQLDQFDGGRMTMLLDNRDRRFDPTNTAGPYYPNVLPMRKVRLRAIWNDLTEHQESLEDAALGVTGWVGGTNIALARTTAQALDGVASLEMTRLNTTGSVFAATGSASGHLFPVVANATYTVRASFRAATTGRTSLSAIIWLDVAKALISISSTSLTDNTTGWTEVTLNAAAPSNAVYAYVVVQCNSCVANEIHYVDDIHFFRGTVDTYSIFTGYADGWPQEWPNNKNATVTLEVSDADKVFGSLDLPLTPWELAIRDSAPKQWYRMRESDTEASRDAQNRVIVHDTQGFANGYYRGGEARAQQAIIAFDNESSAVQFNDEGATKQGFAIPLSAGGIEVPYSVEFVLRAPVQTVTPTILHQRGNVTTPVLDVADGKVRYMESPGGYSLAAPVTRIDDDQTHHVTLTRDSEGAGKYARIFIDGVVDQQVEVNLGLAATIGPNLDTSFFRNFFGGETSSFDVLVDEVVVYDRALSTTEVAAHADAALSGWRADTSDERITRVLDFIDWPAADRDLGAGSSVLQGGSLGGTVLQHIQRIQETERGYRFISPDGKVKLIPRHAMFAAPYITSQATFGDGGGSELPYTDLQLQYDDTTIINEARVTREGGAEQIATDATSQTSFLKRSIAFTGMQSTDLEASDAAHYIVQEQKDPRLEVTNMQIKPRVDGANLWMHALGREIADLVTVKRRPPGGGAVITQDVRIQGVEHRITPRGWETNWWLSRADTGTYWILGTSQLGTNTRLGY